ncbi:hypothetical protein PInf_013116 [Phytophthora infestans]|nr:hypothetical protein PInf_013116 [Phytophthora infestans]
MLTAWYQGLDDPCTLIADLKKEIFSNSSRADIRVKQAVRRYIEEDRDVITWTSRVVPIEIKHKLLRGLTYHMRGYAIIKRSPDSTPERELTVLQLCYLVSLKQGIETTYGHDDARTITDFMVVSLGQNMRGHREFIENALAKSWKHATSIICQRSTALVDKLKRKKTLNETREILRKTGVYGEPEQVT